MRRILLLSRIRCQRIAKGCCIAPSATSKAVRSFWFLGVITNAPWFLMLAVATSISAGGVAMVFVANMLPGLILSISAPYWFHLVSYRARILMASVAMGFACIFVGCGGLFRVEMNNNGLFLQLFGVSLMSLASCLGEASLLALAGKFDTLLPAIAPHYSYQMISEVQNADEVTDRSPENESEKIAHEDRKLEYEIDETESGRSAVAPKVTHRACITAYSSGTGLAGVVGYGYKALLTEYLGWGLSSTVWSAIAFAVAYFLIYLNGLHGLERCMRQTQSEIVANNSITFVSEYGISGCNPMHDFKDNHTLEMIDADTSNLDTRETTQTSLLNITVFERFKLVLSLWPYTIPLFTVYVAEYSIQAGVWSAMGFPVTSAAARAEFYQYSNWAYQTGVFISRSSGVLWTASVPILWLMPFLQVVNLNFFWLDSLHRFWYNYSLMLPCFFAGLLGGSVYVQGFSRINLDMPMELKEFAIASAVVAANFGILVADILSLFLQSCIYDKHGIEGAVVDCPVNM